LRELDLLSGMRTFISNEEHLLLEKIRSQEGHQMCKRDLDEREQLVANQLVHKDVLTRIKKDGKLCYVLPDADAIWRM